MRAIVPFLLVSVVMLTILFFVSLWVEHRSRTRTITLHYPNYQGNGVDLPAGRNRQTLLILPVTDDRDAADVLYDSSINRMFGGPRFVPSRSVAKWMWQGLLTELSRVGFDVVAIHEFSGDEETPTLFVTVDKVRLDPRAGTAALEIEVSLWSTGDLLLHDTFKRNQPRLQRSSNDAQLGELMTVTLKMLLRDLATEIEAHLPPFSSGQPPVEGPVA